MERILIEAWEQIEAKERLDEAKKLGKGKACAIASPKKKVTAVKGKLDEDGVGGPAGAGVGAASNTAAKGDTIVKSGHAAVAPAKLGSKPKKTYENRNARPIVEADPAIKQAAASAAKKSISNISSGKGNETDATLVGTVAEEELPEAPLPPGAEEIAGEVGAEDPAGEAGAEPAPEIGAEDPAGEEGEDVEVDAETAEQVVSAIKAQYPGAIITISVQLPEDTPFDTDLVAAAQEVVDGGATDLDAPPVEAPEADPNLDGVPPENPEQDAADELLEKRKLVITKTRKHIREMFIRLEADDTLEVDGAKPVVDAAPGEGIPQDDGDAAINAAAGEPVAPPEGGPAAVEPEVEVGDTKISLTPEQWGQVLATGDLLSGGADAVDGETAGDAEIAPEGGEEVAPEAGAEEGGEEAPAEDLEELEKVTDKAGALKALKIEPSDKTKTKNKDVAIKPAASAMNESFNAELAGYAEALQKLIKE
jgi:hypothetical protein